MKKFLAFTLAEVMVALALVSTLAAVAVPTVLKVRPNRSRVMFHKAYQVLTDTLSEMSQNPILYPRINDDCSVAGTYQTDSYPCISLNETSGASTIRKNYLLCYVSSGDYCGIGKNLSETLNVFDSSITNAGTNSEQYTFKTPDGMNWTIVTGTASKTANWNNQFVTVTVDVNGVGNGVDTKDGEDPDTFVFKVWYNGKVEPQENNSGVVAKYMNDKFTFHF